MRFRSRFADSESAPSHAFLVRQKHISLTSPVGNKSWHSGHPRAQIKRLTSN
jgi:hypothetical protein